MALWQIVVSDVTEAFIKKFDSLFKQFVTPERTWIYVQELEDEE